MSTISIKGNASNSLVKEILVQDADLKLSLLEFLQNHDIPVASSCFGEGACKRCLINKTVLSCQLTVGRFIELNPSLKIEIDYL